MPQKVRPLSYPLRLPDEVQASAIRLLEVGLPYQQQVVDELWPHLDMIGQIKGKHIYRPLENRLPRPPEVASRVWRCILENGGRTVRAQADRKRVFDLLLPLLSPEHFAPDPTPGSTKNKTEDKLLELAYKLRSQLGDNREKIGYLLNLIEQIGNFYADHSRLPGDYYELQAKPTLKVPQLTMAGDDNAIDGQVYRLSVADGQLTLCFKYPGPDEGQWLWTPEMTWPIPDGVDPTRLFAPTLRLKEIKGGEKIAVLDLIVADTTPTGVPTGDNILAFDWGVRRLLSFVILSRAGEQLAPPTFVNIGGLAGKLARLRRQIDDLKAKKAKLRKRDRGPVEAEIEACWRSYNATNEAMAHFAANLLLLFALIFGCNTIAGEWLGTLKVKKKKNNHFKKVRTLNWKVNTTIREMIWTKLEYRTPRYALQTKKVWPRGSSHECPRCGSRGVMCKSPEHRDKVSPYAHWFFCKNKVCGYNVDRDYVAALNIGRRALVEEYPSEEKTDDMVCQPVSYTGSGAALPFPPPDGREGRQARIPPPPLSGQICLGLLHRLGTTLIGFNQAIAVGPMWLPRRGAVGLPASPG